MAFKCWEFTKCGHEPNGSNTGRDGVCPAAASHKAEDCQCWVVMGTLCHGKVQSQFTDKLKSCLQCDFFKYLSRQRQGSSALLQKIYAEPPPAPEQAPTPPPAAKA
ncbi:MAG TPA: hypothetical protein VGP72_19240 [Planctomycetota bacterium]|jgi:hypothetical protein